ncbi:hypothetical protein AAVH_34377 [Aphelenchoides avenae]|nr:hypothetical protein AAVH_34377 [Aphelenchus avenae]
MDDDDFLSSTELAEKYVRLLQPARDLAENWGVDLDHLVQDFIQEAISQHSQAGERFNFAEAAVIVQGGANVYSRKVDHVYNFALGFFDSLQNKGKGKNSEADDTHDAGDDDAHADVTDPCTLPNFDKYKPPKASRWAGEIPDMQERLTHIPMALQPMGAFEKRNVPIVGRNRKEILGKIEDLRLYSCMFYKSFCILMKKFLPYTSQTTIPPKRVRFAARLENKENHEPGGYSYQGSYDDNDFGGGDFGDITPLAEFPDMEQGPPPDAMSTPKQSLEDNRQRPSDVRQSAEALQQANLRPSDAPQDAFEYEETMPGEPPEENVEPEDEEEEEPMWEPDEYDGNESQDEDGSWPEVRARRPKKSNRDAREAIKQRTKKLEKEQKEKKVQRREVIKDYIHATIFRHTVRKRGVRFAQFQAYLCDNAVLALSNFMHEESERRRKMEKELRRRAQEEQRQSRSRSRTARLSNRNAQAPAAVAPEPEEVEFDGRCP